MNLFGSNNCDDLVSPITEFLSSEQNRGDKMIDFLILLFDAKTQTAPLPAKGVVDSTEKLQVAFVKLYEEINGNNRNEEVWTKINDFLLFLKKRLDESSTKVDDSIKYSFKVTNKKQLLTNINVLLGFMNDKSISDGNKQNLLPPPPSPPSPLSNEEQQQQEQQQEQQQQEQQQEQQELSVPRSTDASNVDTDEKKTSLDFNIFKNFKTPSLPEFKTPALPEFKTPALPKFLSKEFDPSKLKKDDFKRICDYLKKCKGQNPPDNCPTQENVVMAAGGKFRKTKKRLHKRNKMKHNTKRRINKRNKTARKRTQTNKKQKKGKKSKKYRL